MKKSNILQSFVMFIFMLGLASIVMAGLTVVPLQHNFGDVEVGSSSTINFTITNTGDDNLSINNISFQAGCNPNFAISMAPVFSMPILPNHYVIVEVTFTPSSEGNVSTVLQISWTNDKSGVESVNLSGTGVSSSPPPISVDDILVFFDQSVDNGSLTGSDSGQSVEEKLHDLRNMIEKACNLVKDGLFPDACRQLSDAYKRTDGESIPPDFVEGSATSDLASIIQELIEYLGCE
jgi:hypothetical protein